MILYGVGHGVRMQWKLPAASLGINLGLHCYELSGDGVGGCVGVCVWGGGADHCQPLEVGMQQRSTCTYIGTVNVMPE